MIGALMALVLSVSPACEAAYETWEGLKTLQAQECSQPPDTKACHDVKRLRRRAACTVYKHCGGDPGEAERARCAKELEDATP